MLKISGDRVFFKTKFGTYTGEICGSDPQCLYYFYDYNHTNSRCLFDYGFKNYPEIDSFFHKILGYYPPGAGSWPYCKTKEDVIKILRYLSKDKNKNFIPLYLIV